MTTPKEALRIARDYIVDDIKRKPSEYDPAGDLKKIDEALASLEGDAVERVAETAQTFWQGSSGRSWTECCEKLPAQANWFRRLARAILATGLVAGEAAIRADEREKCAKVADAKSDAVMAEAEAAHEDKNYNLYGRLECQAGDYADLAAAIRSQEAGR